MRSSSRLQEDILAGLGIVLRPIARFLLRSGIGFREFSAICKSAFVDVATEEYGVRGRPTNISRVAAMTGLSRKEVARIRDSGHPDLASELWSGKLNPPTEILHYWFTDPNFSDAIGVPKVLKFTGESPSFSDLVRKYAGDLPAGALRFELLRSGAIIEDDRGMLVAIRDRYTPIEVGADFVRSMAFSLSNLANTLVHNAALVNTCEYQELGRLERYVWTAGISEEDAKEFKVLAEKKSAQMLEELDLWIGLREQSERPDRAKPPRDEEGISEKGYGLGTYYFERGASRKTDK